MICLLIMQHFVRYYPSLTRLVKALMRSGKEKSVLRSYICNKALINTLECLEDTSKKIQQWKASRQLYPIDLGLIRKAVIS